MTHFKQDLDRHGVVDVLRKITTNMEANEYNEIFLRTYRYLPIFLNVQFLDEHIFRVESKQIVASYFASQDFQIYRE